MRDRSVERERMVRNQILARGVESPEVLEALRRVPREAFVPLEMLELAYHDRPLPIAEGQTISQPFIVALMTEAARVGPDDRILEVGTGSGYQAAVLAELGARVFTIERHRALAGTARRRFRELGYDSIDVRVGDGTQGWPEAAPFDAIVVTAGGPEEIPPPLLEQLAPAGRLVIPVGPDLEGQELVRIRRSDDGRRLLREELGAVRFVPLVGRAGWSEPGVRGEAPRPRAPSGPELGRLAEPFGDLDEVRTEAFLDRVGDARLVLLGEATHGTSEFYRLRARLTRALVEERGFDFVAVEADWPDAAEIDAYVRHRPGVRGHHKPFQRFPSWMWANREVLDFVHWLRDFNAPHVETDPGRMVAFHGLDLYSLHTSIDAVLRYLDDVDPEAAARARARYACLAPWQADPMLYGRAVTMGAARSCEDDAVQILRDLLQRRLAYVAADGDRFADAVQNARVVRSAEGYYRAVFRGSVASWNLRDRHMHDTLGALLAAHGPGSRGVVWAHNSHLGDARATAMGERGEHNLGQLVRVEFGRGAYLVGFGTHHGTVLAASDWGAPGEVKTVRPSRPDSYEFLSHASGIPRFFLPLSTGTHPDLVRALNERRLERAIGVIYRPDSELQSHYFTAALPRQFDEWIWLDRTRAVEPLEVHERERWVAEGLPESFPFGL